MVKNVHRDVWLGAVLLLFCIFVFVNAVQIRGEAAYLPTVLAIMMAVCALFILLKGIRLTREQKGDFKYPLTIGESKYAFLFMLFIALYYLGFRYITYWIATPIFMILTQKFLKLKSFKVNLIITIIYMVISYTVFVVLLQLPIYRVGILGEWFRF